MSRPVILPNKYGTPSAKLVEVECKETVCQWWHEPFRGCTEAHTCPDVDSGPCNLETCPNCVLSPRQPGWCKMVSRNV